jgi:hypothetical protein
MILGEEREMVTVERQRFRDLAPGEKDAVVEALLDRLYLAVETTKVDGESWRSVELIELAR